MKRINLIQWAVILMTLYICLPIQTANAQKIDFGNLARYTQENAMLGKPGKHEKRIVFLGNSITEGWAGNHPDFFRNNGYIGRGISGQTSYQFLLRFREDVIHLSPALVIINVGTNDIAENTCPYDENRTFGNLISMVELARANKIKVILTSVLPAAAFHWNPDVKDAPQKILSLNERIKTYAKAHHIVYADYYREMVSGENRALNPQYTSDGVHPTGTGYDVMERIIRQVIKDTL